MPVNNYHKHIKISLKAENEPQQQQKTNNQFRYHYCTKQQRLSLVLAQMGTPSYGKKKKEKSQRCTCVKRESQN